MIKYHAIHQLALRGLVSNDPYKTLREIAKITEPVPRKHIHLTTQLLIEHLPGFAASRMRYTEPDKREMVAFGNIWVHLTKEREYFRIKYLINYLKEHGIHTNSAEVGLVLRSIGGGREQLQIDRAGVSVGWIPDDAY